MSTYTVDFYTPYANIYTFRFPPHPSFRRVSLISTHTKARTRPKSTLRGQQSTRWREIKASLALLATILFLSSANPVLPSAVGITHQKSRVYRDKFTETRPMTSYRVSDLAFGAFSKRARDEKETAVSSRNVMT